MERILPVLLKKFILLFMLVFSTSMPFAQVSGQEQYTYLYKLKISPVNDPVAFKDVDLDLYHIFDARPSFIDSEDLIIIRSAFKITNERLAMKLTALGYTLTSYQVVADYQSPK